MCEIPENILEILKCSQCDGYLSSTPIMLTTNGNNICGNCSAPINAETLTTRNIVYEKLALLTLFPCRFSAQGCNKKLIIDEIKKHETECEYHPFECPMTILQNCSWMGKRTNLKQHWIEKHSDLIVTNPLSLPPNINSNNEVCLLMDAYRSLFLVQAKCHVNAAKIWYCVRYIDNPNLANLFEFTLSIGSSSEKLMKKKEVQSGDRLLLSKNDVLEININALLAIIEDSDAKNITCQIKVNLKNKYCVVCKKDKQSSQIFLEENGYRCNTCYSDTVKTKCKYASSGCNYEDIIMNMSKHEMWYCNFSKSICTLNNCGIQMPEHVSLIEHLTSKHITTIMNYYPSPSGYLKDNVWYGDIIQLYGAKFVSNSKFANSKFKYTIISNLTKQGTLFYTCKVRIINPHTQHFIEKELVRDLQTTDHDWTVVIKDPRNVILHEVDENGTKEKKFQCQILIERSSSIIL